MLEQAGLLIAGVDTDDEVRIMELDHHPFFKIFSESQNKSVGTIRSG
jgi:hypothetical protein